MATLRKEPFVRVFDPPNLLGTTLGGAVAPPFTSYILTNQVIQDGKRFLTDLPPNLPLTTLARPAGATSEEVVRWGDKRQQTDIPPNLPLTTLATPFQPQQADRSITKEGRATQTDLPPNLQLSTLSIPVGTTAPNSPIRTTSRITVESPPNLLIGLLSVITAPFTPTPQPSIRWGDKLKQTDGQSNTLLFIPPPRTTPFFTVQDTVIRRGADRFTIDTPPNLLVGTGSGPVATVSAVISSAPGFAYIQEFTPQFGYVRSQAAQFARIRDTDARFGK